MWSLTDILEYTPGKLYVERYVRPKQVLPIEESIVIGEIPFFRIPKGNVQPSESDIAITRKIKGSGSVMDIQLLDHLIIVPDRGYHSIADKGVL